MILNSLLIAAGLSKRMGDFKPLLIYKNKPIVIEIIKKIIGVTSRFFIVTGYNQNDLISSVKKYFHDSETKKIQFIYNRNYEKGMFTSLQSGLKKAKDCDWLLYHFVDQPDIPKKFYSDFISQIDDNFDWIQPAYKNKRGHPVLINNSIFNNIITADENSTLNELTSNINVKRKIWSCNYKEILKDLDTPADYKKLIS